MKIKKLITVVLLIFLSVSVYAANSTQIKIGNIGGTAIATLARGLIEGKVKSPKDVIKMLFYGGMSGYGFYRSKKLIANGKIFPGVLLANMSASIAENAATGNHPLSRIGYSFGFIRMNIYTSFKRINFDISPKDMISLILSFKYANKIVFKNGIISFKAKKQLNDNIGWCIGIYPTVAEGMKEYVYGHETIHMIQNLQFLGVSYEPFFPGRKCRLFNIRVQTAYFVYELFSKFSSYKTNLREIEAFHFIKNK